MWKEVPMHEMWIQGARQLQQVVSLQPQLIKLRLEGHLIYYSQPNICKINLIKEDHLIVRLGPSQSPRPRAWFGPKENTKMGLHTHHHHTNFLTTSRVHRKFRVSIINNVREAIQMLNFGHWPNKDGWPVWGSDQRGQFSQQCCSNV